MTTAAPPRRLADVLIEESFGESCGVLTIGGMTVTDLAKTFGTPLFVYETNVLRRSYHRLADSVRGFAEVYYSVKANPHPAVASVFVSEGAGLEIASLGEFRRACQAGAPPERIIFAGPGKGRAELAATITAGIGEIHLETIEEARHVSSLARAMGRHVPVAIRVNPVASVQGGAMRMGGKPTAFGFDEEDLPEVVSNLLSFDGLDLRGVHLFAGTQILDADVLIGQWRHGLAVASRVSEMLGRPIETIDLGGGLGVPYHDGDRSLDLAAIRRAVPELQATRQASPGISEARVLLEPGRFLTACAGIYLTQVRAVKASRGQRFVITDGGMHHHLAASGNLGQVIKRDYPIVAANRLSDTSVFPATLVGPLCTPLDTYGRQTPLPVLEEGDLVAVLQSGAYGLTASPVNFLSHDPPREIMIDNRACILLDPDT